MTVTIYHNNRCSKSRQVLQLLKERDFTLIEVYYLETPPDFTTLKQILTMLDMTAIDLMRKHEPVFKELELASGILNEDALINVMIENPILIERPIVVCNGKSRIGRPPENILEIL